MQVNPTVDDEQVPNPAGQATQTPPINEYPATHEIGTGVTGQVKVKELPQAVH